jgi:DNA replication protein DnaC
MNTESKLFKLDIAEKTVVCDQHGLYLSRNYILNKWTGCGACATAERIEHDRVEAEQIEKKRQLAWNLKIKDAGIPERFRDRSFKNYIVENAQQRNALDVSLNFSANLEQNLRVGRCLIMCGRPGTGKGHLAAAIGLDALENRKLVMFTTVIRAIRRVKETWNKGSKETESQAVATLVEPDLLILDEVGVQFGTDTEQMILFDVINERYEKRKSTIIISNLGIEDVKKFIGARMFDRLREDGGKYIPFEWESFRGKAENQIDESQIKLESISPQRTAGG